MGHGCKISKFNQIFKLKGVFFICTNSINLCILNEALHKLGVLSNISIFFDSLC